MHPAAITLIMASNPCPCGRRGSPLPCVCADSSVIRYRSRLSGPLLDRVDLHVDLEPLTATELLDLPAGEDSATVRQRVVEARGRQRARGQQRLNGRLRPGEIEEAAAPTTAARALLRDAMDRHHLTARSATRLLRVARTIADLAADGRVEEHHVAGALCWRASLDVL